MPRYNPPTPRFEYKGYECDITADDDGDCIKMNLAYRRIGEAQWEYAPFSPYFVGEAELKLFIDLGCPSPESLGCRFGYRDAGDLAIAAFQGGLLALTCAVFQDGLAELVASELVSAQTGADAAPAVDQVQKEQAEC